MQIIQIQIFIETDKHVITEKYEIHRLNNQNQASRLLIVSRLGKFELFNIYTLVNVMERHTPKFKLKLKFIVDIIC